MAGLVISGGRHELTIPKVWLPGGRELDMAFGGLSDYGRWLLDEYRRIAGGASFSDWFELEVLNAIFKDPDLSALAACRLALCTSVPTDASTGSTIVEANYTGYARLAIATGDVSAAAVGSKTNTATLTFAACTAGSSTIIGWAICDAATVGNMVCWGTATSTVISTTQTPATIAASGLVVNLD